VSASTRNFAFRIDIGAMADRVWNAWINPTALDRWCAAGARMRPREGGDFIARFDSSLEIDAHIDVFLPAQRLRLILMPPANAPRFEGVEIDDFLFEPAGGVTRLRLMNSGLPRDPSWDDYFARKRVHWQRALARLKVFVEKNLDRLEDAP
jgi:uncharacterized protein YndB with AHSA1/START domain